VKELLQLKRLRILSLEFTVAPQDRIDTLIAAFPELTVRTRFVQTGNSSK
jgi:hypothetical protein